MITNSIIKCFMANFQCSDVVNGLLGNFYCFATCDHRLVYTYMHGFMCMYTHIFIYFIKIFHMQYSPSFFSRIDEYER